MTFSNARQNYVFASTEFDMIKLDTWAVGTMLKESCWKCRSFLAISRTAVEPPESTDPDINMVSTPPINIKDSAKSVHNNLDFPGSIKKLNY